MLGFKLLADLLHLLLMLLLLLHKFLSNQPVVVPDLRIALLLFSNLRLASNLLFSVRGDKPQIVVFH